MGSRHRAVALVVPSTWCPSAPKIPPLGISLLDYATGDNVGGHLDLGKRFGEDNRFGARINLAQHDGGTGVDDEAQHSTLVAVALDYRGERLRLSTDLGYQKERINQGRAVIYPNGSKVPHAPSARDNYSQDWTWSQLEDTYGMVNAEYDLNDNWMLYAGAGAKHTRENGEYSSLYVSDANGTARGGFPVLAPRRRQQERRCRAEWPLRHRPGQPPLQFRPVRHVG